MANEKQPSTDPDRPVCEVTASSGKDEMNEIKKEVKSFYVCDWLLFAIVYIFLCQCDMDMPGSQILGFKTLTSVLLHEGVVQFFLSIWFLSLFGRAVEKTVGGTRYLLLYVLSAKVGSFIVSTLFGVQNYSYLGAFAVAGVIGAMLALYSTAKIDTQLENEFWFLGVKSSMVPVPVLITLWAVVELILYLTGLMPVSTVVGTAGALVSGVIFTIAICAIKQNPIFKVSVAQGTTE